MPRCVRNVDSVNLAQFGKDSSVEISPDPKSGRANQLIEHGLREIDQPGSFRLCYHTEKACYLQACRSRCLPPSSFIHEQEIGSTFDCEHDRLSLARVQSLAQPLHPRFDLQHSRQSTKVPRRGRSEQEDRA